MNDTKINVSGKLNSLAVGEKFTLDRTKYKISYLRWIAQAKKADTGKRFSVNTNKTDIIVTRTA